MRDIDRALADITSIRSHLAAGTLFRGFGPAVMAVTGGLAMLAAAAQSMWPAALAADPLTYLLCWVVTAAIAAALIGAEMMARSRRHHGGLADAMILNAVGQFLPAGIAGVAIAAVLIRFAPDALWLLPGLWQILVALGIFASLRSLPRAVALVGAWYFVAGVGVLIVAGAAQPLLPPGAGTPGITTPGLLPWLMGLPFAVGQFLMAAVLHLASEDPDAED